MLYLASQFAWFLIAAFVLGLVMGRIGHDGERSPLGGAALVYVGALWVLVAAATWLQLLNGVLALWLESGLLFVAAYFAGCLLSAATMPATEPQPSAVAGTGPAIVPIPGSEPKLEPAAAPAGPLPKVEGEDAIPGQRPAGLVAARTGAADDLKVIRGIGPQNEERLHQLGIWHFDQIAAWTPQNIEWVGSYLAFPGRIEREDWVGQAETLQAKLLAPQVPAEKTPGA